MKKVIGLLLTLVFVTSAAFSFEFVDSKKALLLGANVGIGNGFSIAGHFEMPPYGDLKILSFIPGFCMDLQVGTNNGLFVQNAVCVRVKPTDSLPLIAKAGAGLGVTLRKNVGTPLYFPVVVGADYFFTDKLAAMTTMTFGDGFKLTLGVGFGFGFTKSGDAAK